MLRTLFVAVFLSLYCLLAGPPLLIYTVITRNPDPLYWAGLKGVLFFVKAAGVRIRVEGRNNIPPGVCLFVANHTSSVDAPAVVGAIPRRVAILLKESLFKWPIAGQAFRCAHFIPVNRSARESAIASVEQATEEMKKGQSFLIYPEGTRSPDGRLQEFKKGAVVMAIKAGVPIVPMVCSGAHRVMEKKSLVIRPGEIVVKFLDPIDTSQYPFEERDVLNQKVHDVMAAALPQDQRPVGFDGQPKVDL
ncbi:MAG TPA: lysophospholipid acyltransferase family protein [Candidatus Dormibacteraeota bacterium]|nr:lysophospholipid acyltransferase family protein [Candidatus Dormibacteraeota bacterium]